MQPITVHQSFVGCNTRYFLHQKIFLYQKISMDISWDEYWQKVISEENLAVY